MNTGEIQSLSRVNKLFKKENIKKFPSAPLCWTLLSGWALGRLASQVVVVVLGHQGNDSRLGW